MAGYQWPLLVAEWLQFLSLTLDARVARKLPVLLAGVLFARGRRTVSRWLAAVGVGKEFKRYYYALGSLGRKIKNVALRVVVVAIRWIPGCHVGEFVTLAIDDTPTKRYGPHVEGAGRHHNPTPGPADAKFLYGHLWVTIAWVVVHPLWGAIALPLRALMYIRKKDQQKMPREIRQQFPFRTKLELAGELVQWAAGGFVSLGKRLLVVADGAYAKRPFLKEAALAGAVVVSRLRKDAALYDLPPEPQPGQKRRPGGPRKYGPKRISLAKRAAHRQGWQRGEFRLYGRTVSKTYKTFLATWKPAGGVIRVVIVREEHGWLAVFSTDPDLSVATILEAVADRFAIEQCFHDVKEVHGAGQQQVRNIHANIGCFHLCLWMHTLVELWAWRRSAKTLADRRDRPWDDPHRRPSHADRCRALKKQCLSETFSAVLLPRRITGKIQTLINRLVQLAT